LSASPVMRAAALLQLRLTPAVLAAGATLLALFAFFEYEPRDNGERTGVLLVLLSTGAASLLAVSVIRSIAGQVRTARLVRGWARTAERIVLPDAPAATRIQGRDVPCFAIDSAFPIVAVAGLTHPRLFISRVVLNACPPEELGAILQHERAHIARRDNL